MNRLLPYCPESLELLIDTCSTCGQRQGWRHAWGINTCDVWACRSLLTHPTGEKLADELIDDYRLFAAIVSSDPDQRDAALAGVDPKLSTLPPAVLVSMILQLGSTVSSERARLHKNTIQNLEPQRLASIVARGAHLIRDWPHTFRNGVVEEMMRIGLENGSEQRRFVMVVRKLADRTVRPEQAVAIHDALPEASEHAGMALSKLLTPVVNGSEVCRRCLLNPADLRSLRSHNLIPFRMATGKERIQAQYDEAAVAAMEKAFRQSEFASRLEQKLGIPRYASEQLACLGLVEQEDHPALLHLEKRLCLRKRSVEQLVQELENAGRRSPRPIESLKLRTAIKRFGGGPKPWAALLSALRAGEVPFWLEGSGRFIQRAYVMLADLERFTDLSFDEAAWPAFRFQQFMTQIDANEVLNLDNLQLRRVLNAGELLFKASGVSVITNRADVLKLAEQNIAAGEIALRLGVHFVAVPGFMAKNHPDVRRTNAGWGRGDFELSINN